MWASAWARRRATLHTSTRSSASARGPLTLTLTLTLALALALTPTLTLTPTLALSLSLTLTLTRSGCGDELRPPGSGTIVLGADYQGAWTTLSLVGLPWLLGWELLCLHWRRGGRAHLLAAHCLLTTHTAYPNPNPNPSPSPNPNPSPHYSGAWTDESTFVVTVLDASGSEVALGETVVMARHAPSTAAAIAHRPIRFKGGVSAQANSTSPSPHL